MLHYGLSCQRLYMSMCVCVRACVCACVCMCIHMCDRAVPSHWALTNTSVEQFAGVHTSKHTQPCLHAGAVREQPRKAPADGGED
jgi:hypothetical protein